MMSYIFTHMYALLFPYYGLKHELWRRSNRLTSSSKAKTLFMTGRNLKFIR